MKPIVAASQESLILAGKQLIESHVYTMCGVINTDELKELVIYIKDMTAEELAAFQDSEGTAPISLPRYKEDGNSLSGTSMDSPIRERSMEPPELFRPSAFTPLRRTERA